MNHDHFNLQFINMQSKSLQPRNFQLRKILSRFTFALFVLGCVCLIQGCDKKKAATDDLQALALNDSTIKRGEFDSALLDCRAYIKEYPNSFTGWCLLGWAHLGKEEMKEAQQCFEQSIAINSQSDNAYVGMGVISRKQGDILSARKSYLKAIQIRPENGEAYSSLAVIEMMDKNFDKAVEFGEMAWKLNASHPSIAANLSIAYHYKGDLANRDIYFDHAKALGYSKLERVQRIFAESPDLSMPR